MITDKRIQQITNLISLHRNFTIEITEQFRTVIDDESIDLNLRWNLFTQHGQQYLPIDYDYNQQVRIFLRHIVINLSHQVYNYFFNIFNQTSFYIDFTVILEDLEEFDLTVDEQTRLKYFILSTGFSGLEKVTNF